MSRWLDQLPWWQFAPLYGGAMALVFALGCCVAAWSAGGETWGDLGFTSSGRLDIRALGLNAAIFTAIVLVARTWRRRRKPRESGTRAAPWPHDPD